MLTPWPHQMETATLASQCNKIFDMSDPGVGKTSAHLLAFDMRRAQGEATQALVVCPKTLMRSAWANEIDQFFPHMDYGFADAGRRFECFERRPDIVIVNTDGVKDLAKNTKALIGFSDLIIDESDAFKHAGSQRSAAMKKLSNLFQNKYLLSGTPHAGSVTELWHQLLILDGGERLGTSFYHFRNATQVAKQVGPNANHLKWEDKPESQEAIFSLIQDIVIRHAFEDVMKHVPANHVARYDFDLNSKTMRLYKELENDCVLQLADGSISAVHAAALRTKLLQLASGAVYLDEERYAVVDTQRYELGADLIEEQQHSVCFFVWRHQKEQMQRVLEGRGLAFAVIDGTTPDSARARIVADYQAGKFRTLLLHPRTGAHGLTLTRGTRCILLSPIYEANLMKQAIHRIYRGSQDQITNTVLVQARNTVEDLVFDRRLHKSVNMNDFLALAVEAQARRR
jgi:SNF2 family DNA or RNA helicase